MPSIQVYRSAVSDQQSNFWRGRRVLVTGASGFLGTAVVRLLARYGADVHGTGRTRMASEPAVHHAADFPGDAERVVAKVVPAHVIHLAAPVAPGGVGETSSRLRSGIVDAALAMGEATGRLGIPMLHCGTCAEYGDVPAPFCEQGLTRPIDAYGSLKLEASEGLRGKQHVTIARPFRAIGPGDRSSVIAAAARAAIAGEEFRMTSGEQLREWNHVHAIAEGLIRAAGCSELQGEVVNIGGGPTASVLEAVQFVYEAAGADTGRIAVGALPQRPGEIPLLAGDHSKAHSLWGNIAQPPLQDTIREAVEWVKQSREDAA